MDINEVISIAKQNKNEAKNLKKTGYSTQLKGPKKLGKNVDPKAIQAFLNRKKEDEKRQAADQKVKKKELTKLRDEKNTSRKARAMASRTKDNLLGYKGEDCLGLYKEKRGRGDPILTAEEEMKHQAFMNKILKIPKLKAVEEIKKPPLSESERRHEKQREKNRKRARTEASGLNFTELLSLAENKTKQSSDDNSSVASDSDSDNDDNLSTQEKFERERRKRKALEAKLKSQNGLKRKSDNNSSNFKIAKLSKGLSEVDKREKIKQLMSKYKNKKGETSGNQSSSYSNNKVKKTENRKGSNSNSTNSISKTYKPNSSKNKVNISKPLDKRKDEKKNNFKTTSKSLKPNLNENKSQLKTNPYMNEINKKKEMQKRKEELTKRKQPPNPYSDIMEKAKGNLKPKTQCTLSVTSSGVRTNYPGVSETDPRSSKVYRNSVMDANKQRALQIFAKKNNNGGYHHHPLVARNALQRPQALWDDDEDEYDSDMEGFIDDEEDGNDLNITATIGKLFGYDKSKYGRESEYELSKMDASYRDIQREEKWSSKIAQQEDAKEAKLEEERLRKKKMKKR